MERKEVNINEVTPMMRQYLEIKNKNEDLIIFFRLGDFYEMFFDDAILVSHELELTLTGKNAGLKERVPMCGVPYHSVTPYIEKLVDKGYKVAICEQMEDPKTHTPYTAHTATPVQAVLVCPPDDVKALSPGRLADVAPTLLQLMHLPQPAEMTGHSLLVKK